MSQKIMKIWINLKNQLKYSFQDIAQINGSYEIDCELLML